MEITHDILKAHKAHFAEMVDLPNAGHKLINAAKALRDDYVTLTDTEKSDLIEWVQLISALDRFITGEDQSYYVRIAVPKKGLRRANLEHLAKYSSEEVGDVDAADGHGDEYQFNIWKSEYVYIKTFLKQYDIEYRLVE